MEENKFSKYINDNRDEETIRKQSNIIKKIADRNLSAFQPYINNELQSKQNESIKSKSIKPNILRMNFSEGRYVEYRDNLSELLSNRNKSNTLEEIDLSKNVIIMISGIPGGVKYFRKIEDEIGNNFCRVINLYIPGVDKKDERRGSYQGFLSNIVRIIEDFMNNLEITKAHFLLHSFGGVFVKYFAYCKPEKVQSIIQIASIPITLWKGFKLLTAMQESLYDLDMNQDIDTLLSDSYREQLNIKFIQAQKEMAELPIEQQKQFGPMSLLSIYDVQALLKVNLSYDGQMPEILSLIRQVSKSIPRMIVYSPNDNLIEGQLVEEEIYEFIVGENANHIQLDDKYKNDRYNNKNNVELDKNNLCGNYIFRFDDSTHMVHEEKGQEIGILVKHFIQQLNSYKHFKYYSHPKL